MKKSNFDIEKMIRPICSLFQPYVAGKPVETIKRELGLKTVIKLASNENPLGPSKKAVEAIKKAASKVYFYPDSNSWKLREALAKKFDVAQGNIILGAGSDEIIELIGKAFLTPEDEIIISEHAFIRYQMAAQLMDCRFAVVPMQNYTHDLDAMADHITKRTKAVFIANPNNPTGTYNSASELDSFLRRVAAMKNVPLVVMDEAYYEYARVQKDYPETLKLLAKYPNLLILRTFSKIYGLAGLRVGYGFGSKEVIGYLDRIRPPFNINLIAQEAAVASLADKNQVSRSLALIAGGKEYLYSELQKRGIPFIPTVANFVLIDVNPFAGAEIFKRLLREGVIARAMDEYELPYHIRVTFGLPEENRRFIKALDKVLK